MQLGGYLRSCSVIGSLCFDMRHPEPLRAATWLIALALGITLALSVSLIVKIWVPRLAPVLFVVLSAGWIYAGLQARVVLRKRH